MREMLSCELNLSKAGSDVMSQASSHDSLLCHDPFYDRFPWFRLVGR